MGGFRAEDVGSQEGRCFLVTGANTGLGYEAAKVLAARGGRVLFGCRSEERALAAMRQVEDAHPGVDIAFVELDQADLSSVRRCADQVLADESLDVLVNNAGLVARERVVTVDGFESQFAINHLGTFALTGLLLPALRDRKDARIVITASLAHTQGQIFFEDLQAEDKFRSQARYSQSKLANLLHMLELDRRLRAADAEAIAVACHPGLAATDIARDMQIGRLLLPVIRPLFNSAAEGAWTTLQAATDPGAKGGEYFGPTRRGETAGPSGRARIRGQARDPEIAERLWDISVELAGVDPGV
ncbi:MAG: oxidoreductase [Actinomycetota bacterium]